MFLFGCPVGLRQLMPIMKDQIRHVRHRFDRRSRARVHVVYFSCARDTQLLLLSLQSLRRMPEFCRASVNIVVDEKGPFDAGQEASICSLFPAVRFLHLGKIDWASLDTLKTELKAFSIVAEQADPEDLIAKVDSDILFFSATKLDEVCASREDFIGDGHYSGYGYAQGGLYFMRATVAQALRKYASLERIEQAIDRCGIPAEDQVVSALLKEMRVSRWLTRLMLFPGEYERARINSAWVRAEFATIHFVHRKKDMPVYLEKICGIC